MPHILRKRYVLGHFAWVIGALAVLRIAQPLAVLAVDSLPHYREFEYEGLAGDATGFYAAARELVESWARVPAAATMLAGWTVSAVLYGVVIAWRSRRAPRWALATAAVWTVALAYCIPVAEMEAVGAAVVGWPLAWSLPLHVSLAVGVADQPDMGYAIAVALSLAANAATVVAVAYGALYATARAGVAIAASALFALWPALSPLVSGRTGFDNGTWAVDAGLTAYSEPLSTALGTTALALLLSPRPTDLRLAIAGGTLGLATLVKLSNGLVAAMVVGMLVAQHGRRALAFALPAAAFVPLVALYWPKGYPAILEQNPNAWPDERFALAYARDSWTESHFFTPRALLVLLPLALFGALVVRHRPRYVLLAWVVVTALVYSFYFATAQHPRFLFAALPPLFILWAAGAAALVDAARRSLRSRSRDVEADEFSGASAEKPTAAGS